MVIITNARKHTQPKTTKVTTVVIQVDSANKKGDKYIVKWIEQNTTWFYVFIISYEQYYSCKKVQRYQIPYMRVTLEIDLHHQV